MDVPREDPQGLSSPDIASALADFARLAQQVLVASTPETTEAFAIILLKRLLSFCGMQQGALLLATRSHASSKPSFWLSERKTWRVLARYSINDDDLFARLSTFSGVNALSYFRRASPLALLLYFFSHYFFMRSYNEQRKPGCPKHLLGHASHKQPLLLRYPCQLPSKQE